MQNKGIVLVTAVLLTLASIFYLSFSVATSYYDGQAAKIKDPIAQQDYKDYVHTALKVKTQTDLSLKAVLIRIDAKILYRILVILLGTRILNLSSLTVIVACSHRERQVEDACKRQKSGGYKYNSFVLHFD